MQLTTIKVTPRDHQIIREGIRFQFGQGLTPEARVSQPFNPEDGDHTSFNAIYFDRQDIDHDLADLYGMRDFTELELVDGDAEVDLYIYRQGSLQCNADAVWRNGRLHTVDSIAASSLGQLLDNRKRNTTRRKGIRKHNRLARLAERAASAASDPAALPRPDGFADSGRSGNCAIVALASLTGVAYPKVEAAVWADIAKRGLRKHKGRWNGATWTDLQYPTVSAKLGKRLKQTRIDRQQLKTLFSKLDPAKKYAVQLTRHIVTVHAGLVMDQQGAYPIAQCWCRTKVARSVWELA
jgi:hypothetical protein